MKILIAVDGSACSDAAVNEVCKRPWPDGSEMRVLTVDPPWDTNRGEKMASAYDELIQEQRVEAYRHLNAAAAKLRESLPNVAVNPVLREGWPKDVIVQEAEDWAADVIVIGSNGYGALRRFILGSVSLAIIANAPCSVLVVRQPPEKPVESDGT